MGVRHADRGIPGAVPNPEGAPGGAGLSRTLPRPARGARAPGGRDLRPGGRAAPGLQRLLDRRRRDPPPPGGAPPKAGRRPEPKAPPPPTKTPALPTASGDALPLPRALAGPGAPEAWRGGLPTPSPRGPGPATVRLKLAFDWSLAPAR